MSKFSIEASSSRTRSVSSDYFFFPVQCFIHYSRPFLSASFSPIRLLFQSRLLVLTRSNPRRVYPFWWAFWSLIYSFCILSANPLYYSPSSRHPFFSRRVQRCASAHVIYSVNRINNRLDDNFTSWHDDSLENIYIEKILKKYSTIQNLIIYTVKDVAQKAFKTINIRAHHNNIIIATQKLRALSLSPFYIIPN